MKSLLIAFSFNNECISWKMKPISSTFFSIIVNGVPSQPFSPTRGIRKCDPLSPFLFVIMSEGLGHYIKFSIQNGSLQGLHLHGLQPESSHNQFVDDTMLMNTPTAQEAKKLRSILNDFSEASRTTFNLAKSQLFFFNTPEAIQHHISQLMIIPIYSLTSQYMGLPLSNSTAKKISWDSLILSISNHLNNWTFFSLNLPARLILLKFVLQAIPAYLF
jgi:hypothetical protein